MFSPDVIIDLTGWRRPHTGIICQSVARSQLFCLENVVPVTSCVNRSPWGGMRYYTKTLNRSSLMHMYTVVQVKLDVECMILEAAAWKKKT